MSSTRIAVTSMQRIQIFIRTILGMIRSLFLNSRYGIRRGYFHRNKYDHFSDIGNTDEWQKEVYETAVRLAGEHNIEKIVDVGCGSGYKLVNYFGEEYETVGIEVEDTYSHLLRQYPDHIWLDGASLDYSTLSADMVISSDVIEHVLDPDAYLDNIKKIKGVKLIIISTPDRLLLGNKFGPPINRTHMREWTGREFRNYLTSQGLKVISHQISNYAQATQMVVCEKA